MSSPASVLTSRSTSSVENNNDIASQTSSQTAEAHSEESLGVTEKRNWTIDTSTWKHSSRESLETNPGSEEDNSGMSPAKHLSESETSNVTSPTPMSYDEEIYNPDGEEGVSNNGSTLSDRSSSDRVGQMQRGFANLPNESSDYEVGTEYEAANSVNAESELFTYGNKKVLLTEEEIVSVAIHDLKLSHCPSRAASTVITALLERFAGEAHCWDYRITQKWIEEQTGVKAISYDCCRKSCMSFAIYPEKE